MDLLQRSDRTSANFDEVIPPLLPMSGCSAYQLPFRLLSKRDFLLLSGLGHHWTMTDPDDAERLPDTFIRNTCGNSFHPALISAAQCKVFSLYAELGSLIKRRGEERRKRQNIPVVEELPRYPRVELVEPDVPLPAIEQPTIVAKRDVRVHKDEQRLEFGIDATVHLLNENACLVLQQATLDPYLDALRAPVTFTFDSHSLLRALWGDTQILKAR